MVSIGDEIRKYIFKEIKVTRIIFLKESTTIFKKKTGLKYLQGREKNM